MVYLIILTVSAVVGVAVYFASGYLMERMEPAPIADAPTDISDEDLAKYPSPPPAEWYAEDWSRDVDAMLPPRGDR